MRRKTWSYVIVSVALAGTLQACGGGSGGGTVGATDTTPPTITAFTLPATAGSLAVSVNSFTATDDTGVTGFMVTQSATPPAATAAGWTATAPATVTAAAAGSQTFFPWAKDGAGNVSAAGTPVTVNIDLTAPTPDATAPAVTAFTLPATAVGLTVSVNSFTATDNVAVTGYMVTQSATPPAATAAGWTATAPATVTAAAAGSQTFFPWAKDAAGNVSAVGTPVTVVVSADNTAPAVTAFTLPASAASLIVSVSTFTATDNVAVTGFMVTQSATPPAAGAAEWTATATATVTAAAAGSQTFFPWAKDAAGNVSAVGTPATVTITLPPASVAVSASGTDTTSAVGVDATFTFAAVPNVPYTFNITGFGAGDKLVFPVFGGAPNLIDIINLSPTDGIVTVHLRRGVGGDQFEIFVVLNGLTAVQDGQIVDGERDPFTSFKAVFGANSIQQL